MKIKCIIVDDEPISREILKSYVSECDSLDLIMSCKNGFEALEIVSKEEIELIFLDVNMPKLSGLNFYKSLKNPPLVIFTTAYPEYAVEGFEVNAIDYLLKPFSFERFLKSINKALEIIDQKNISDQNTYVVLKSDKKLYRIKIKELIFLEAMGDYVKIFYSNQSITVHETFQNILGKLNESNLYRVHKSFAISLDKFDHIEGNIIKIGNKSIPIGQTYRSAFLNVINSTR